jgi:hypothetical protein
MGDAHVPCPGPIATALLDDVIGVAPPAFPTQLAARKSPEPAAMRTSIVYVPG